MGPADETRTRRNPSRARPARFWSAARVEPEPIDPVWRKRPPSGRSQ